MTNPTRPAPPPGATHWDNGFEADRAAGRRPSYMKYDAHTGKWFFHREDAENPFAVWQFDGAAHKYRETFINLENEMKAGIKVGKPMHKPQRADESPCETAYQPNEMILEEWMAEVATLSGVLYGWMECDGYKPIYQQIADTIAGHDAQRGACLRLSLEVMRIIGRIVDWDNYDGGVFSYDHLEDLSQGIPQLLTDSLSVDQIAHLAANYVMPANLEKLLIDYVRDAEDLDLKHDPEREETMNRFVQELGLTRETALKAYKLGWRKSK